MPVGKSLESSLQWLLEAECLLVRGRIGGNERASGHAEREERAFDPPGPRAQGASSRAKRAPGKSFLLRQKLSYFCILKKKQRIKENSDSVLSSA